jgi:hypothetical protein
MPRLSTWFVRASLIYLALGFTLGALMQTNQALNFSPYMARLLPVHIEVLLMGWFIQLAVGVAFWILPRWSSNPHPRGNEQLVWLAFGLINLGIWLIIVEAITSWSILTLVGRLAELGGVSAFVIASWKRIKTFGAH